MATNKNALIRYKVLDNCFRNLGKKYFIKDLIEACENVLLEINSGSNGISRRQVFEDIAYMESAEGWNIELAKSRDGKKVYYRYADPSFSINNMPLNEVEISQLQSAADILSQFKGMPQFEWIDELVPKLKQGISSKKPADIIIEFDSNQYLKGIEYLGVLYNAILYKKVLKISYRPYENEHPSDIILHPNYLKQYNNRWFLFGYYPEKDKYDWNLALDRIENIKEIEGKFKKNEIIWADYFEDVIGVTKPAGETPQKIELLFFGKTGNYIESKPLHGSQKCRWINDSTLKVSLQLIINYELERLILSYADSVKVETPTELKDRIIGRLYNAGKIYTN